MGKCRFQKRLIMNKTLPIIFLITLFVSSCYNDSEETLFPQNFITSQCDTSVFTYSAAIKPMIDASCLTCHSTRNPVLNNYSDITQNATRILGSIKHQVGFMAMPQGSAKLEDCKIVQFEKWVSNGKKND